MLKEDWLVKLEAIVEDICVKQGCRLYDLEFVSGSKGAGRALRIYLERAQENTNDQVGLKDCENVSRSLNEVLDAAMERSEDLIPGGEYSLEVSTPGLERKLNKKWHFEAALGQLAQVRTATSLTEFNPELDSKVKRMNAKGVIQAVNDLGIVLEVDGKGLNVPYEAIERANLVFDFDSQKGKKK